MAEIRRLPHLDLPATGGEVLLDAAASRHAKVLRLAVGDSVTLFDGHGQAAEACIAAFGREGVRCDVQAPSLAPEPAHRLQLILGLPKGGKVEAVVRMLTELGVSELHLAQCRRSVPRPRDHTARLERLSRVALEACAQSGQPRAPTLHALAPLDEVAARAADDASKLVFWERATEPLEPWREAARPREVWAVVGPEGGLEDTEVEALGLRGFRRVGLGAAALRVETAAPVAAALLLDRLGRLRF